MTHLGWQSRGLPTIFARIRWLWLTPKGEKPGIALEQCVMRERSEGDLWLAFSCESRYSLGNWHDRCFIVAAMHPRMPPYPDLVAVDQDMTLDQQRVLS